MAVWQLYCTFWLSLISLASALTLLSAIATDPELSTLTAVIAGMGTSPEKPDPHLEERFNSKLDGRKFTFFAPTNAAFAKIPASQVKALTSPSNYELLLSVIRTHVAEGYFPASSITNTTAPVISVEGFPLSFQGTKINSQATITATDFQADNGIYHKINTVLNPYTSYFGLSSPTGKALGANINDQNASLRDLLTADEELDTYLNVTNIVAPYRLLRDSCPSKDGQALPLFLIFSDTAFSVLPPSSYSSFISPSNNALSAYLLNAGRVENVTKFGISASTALIPRIKAAGGTLALTGETGLTILFRVTGEDDELLVGNARVEKELCSEGGCVWVLDRVLDPLYGILGV